MLTGPSNKKGRQTQLQIAAARTLQRKLQPQKTGCAPGRTLNFEVMNRGPGGGLRKLGYRGLVQDAQEISAIMMQRLHKRRGFVLGRVSFFLQTSYSSSGNGLGSRMTQSKLLL